MNTIMTLLVVNGTILLSCTVPVQHSSSSSIWLGPAPGSAVGFGVCGWVNTVYMVLNFIGTWYQLPILTGTVPILMQVPMSRVSGLGDSLRTATASTTVVVIPAEKAQTCTARLHRSGMN
jgi:hypothetical protein